MRKAFKSLLLAFTTLIAGTVAYAQVTTSSLSGRVVDQAGEPVIGAAVVATHEPSGTVYGAVTNADGRYTIQGMRTGGPYKVDFSCLGYQEATYTGVSLQLAETFALDAKIAESNEMLEGTIVIASPTSKFNAQERTGAVTNIASDQITAMPTVNRSITDVTRLSPYGGNGMSFAGSDGRTANFTVDGANFNNNFGLSSNLPGGGNPISIDAIEELQVVISPYDVRQTNFIGGGVRRRGRCTDQRRPRQEPQHHLRSHLRRPHHQEQVVLLHQRRVFPGSFHREPLERLRQRCGRPQQLHLPHHQQRP